MPLGDKYIYKTSRGDWRVANPPDKWPPKMKSGFKEKTEARKYRDEVWAENTDFEQGSIGWLLAQFEAEGFKFKPGKPLSPKTVSGYKACARLLSDDSVFGHMPIGQLDHTHLDGFQRAMQDRPAYCNRLLSLLRTAYRFAMRRGWAKFNPVAGLGFLSENAKVKDGKPVNRPITPDEWSDFKAIAPPELLAYAALMLGTGITPGDVLKLHTDDISDDGISITRGKTKSRVLVERNDFLDDAIKLAYDVRGHNRPGRLLPAATENAWRLRWEKFGRNKYKEKYGRRLFTRYSLRTTAGTLAEERQSGAGHLLLANTPDAFKIHYDHSVKRVPGVSMRQKSASKSTNAKTA